MSVEEIAPSDRNNHESIAVILQADPTLRFACYGGLLFLTIQIALSRVAPGFDGHRWYSFFLLALVGLTAGCASWAWGIVLSPIGSQAGGAQKVLAGFAVFWTEVIVGHLPQIASAFSGWQKTSINQAARIEVLFGLGYFFSLSASRLTHVSLELGVCPEAHSSICFIRRMDYLPDYSPLVEPDVWRASQRIYRR